MNYTKQKAILFIGQIIHCLLPYKLKIYPNGYLLVGESGKILSIGNETELSQILENRQFHIEDTVKLSKTQLLIPGFIDSHIHAPQYPNAGLGYDKPLLEWLDSYTYKLEKQYKNNDLSKKVYNALVRKTLDHGTTTACYFASLFLESSLILADAVEKHGQRAFIGKINMIKLAPDDYVETPEESINNTLKFVTAIKSRKNDLIQPIITPRFALSVDMDHMKKLAAIAKQYDLNIQSHISENKAEVQMISDTYNDSYANVYDKAGLLGNKTIMAHGVYLSDDELETIRKTGTGISHCPESNTLLQSGLCNVNRLKENDVKVGLGTDVSGGASPSILSSMRAAITTSIHVSYENGTYQQPLTYADAFYLATLGGAKALALDKVTGNFEIGKSFDALLVDLDIKDAAVDYVSPSELNTEELLQKLVFVGDDRNIIKVYVNGKSVK